MPNVIPLPVALLPDVCTHQHMQVVSLIRHHMFPSSELVLLAEPHFHSRPGLVVFWVYILV